MFEDLSFAKIVDPLTEKLITWAQELVAMLPNLVLALIIVAVAGLVSRPVRRAVHSALSKVTDNLQMSGLLSKIASLSVIGIGLFIALGVLGLEKTVTSLLAGAGVVGLAIGFAAQEMAANFMSGVMIAVRRPFRVGDWIESDGIMGKVQELGFRATVLRTADGRRVLVPNKDLFGNALTNWSMGGRIRVEVPVGVAYGDDPAKAIETLCKALDGLSCRVEDREAEVFATAFGGSSIDLLARVWIDFSGPIDLKRATSEMVVTMKSALDREGFTIPFPIRTLDFGVVGGRSLVGELDKLDGGPVLEAMSGGRAGDA